MTPDRDKDVDQICVIHWCSYKEKRNELNDATGTGSTFKAISRKVLEMQILVPNVDLKEQSKYCMKY